MVGDTCTRKMTAVQTLRMQTLLSAQVADKEAGANCPTALRSAALAALGQLPPRPRFQPNSVDEVGRCVCCCLLLHASAGMLDCMRA